MFKKIIKDEFLKYGLDIGEVIISHNELRFYLKYSYSVNLSAYKIIIMKIVEHVTEEYLEIHYTNIRYSNKKTGVFVVLTIPKYNYPKDIPALVSLIKEIESLNNLYDFIKKLITSIEA
jgi:hypothetical protein